MSDQNNIDTNSLRSMFAGIREEKSKTIGEYILRMVDIKEYVNCEVFFHSERMRILDMIHTYVDYMTGLQLTIDRRKSNVLDDILSNPQKNFAIKSRDERIILVDGDASVSKLKELIAIYDNQIQFLSETKKGLDGIIYNMKHRVDVQKMMNVC